MATILVVDDEGANRELLRAVLTVDGHDVHVAANGDEALSELDAIAADLLVVDLYMPVLSGSELIRRVRRDTRHDEVKIALYTGTAVDEMMRDFMALNRIDYIVPKPAEPEEILTAVRKALS